jgi:hypothetical protein
MHARHTRSRSTALRTGIVVCAAIALSGGSSGTARAQDDHALDPSPNMAARIRWVQFHMLSGRVVASSPMVVPRTIVPMSSRTRPGRREALSIEINYGVVNLQYELATTTDRLEIAITQGDRIVLRHTRGEAYLLEYQQPPNEPLTLLLRKDGVARTWKTAGFWHLYLAEPEVVRGHLIPLLELLHPAWQLANVGAEIEQSLVTASPTRAGPDRERWTQLVAELASPEFAKRQQAQRALYRAGQIIVPFLQNLDRGSLDAEQAYRVRALVDSLSVGYDDKVDRVVTWLAGDEQVWLVLMGREDAAIRRVAAKSLESLVSGPIEFDPEADAAARAEQLARLRGRLNKPAPLVNGG